MEDLSPPARRRHRFKRSLSPDTISDRKRIHREKERRRHTTLVTFLDDLCKKVPSDSPCETKVYRFSRVIRYCRFLESVIQELTQESDCSHGKNITVPALEEPNAEMSIVPEFNADTNSEYLLPDSHYVECLYDDAAIVPSDEVPVAAYLESFGDATGFEWKSTEAQTCLKYEIVNINGQADDCIKEEYPSVPTLSHEVPELIFGTSENYDSTNSVLVEEVVSFPNLSFSGRWKLDKTARKPLKTITNFMKL